MLKVQRHIIEHVNAPPSAVSHKVLATIAGMKTCSVLARFNKAFGETPLAMLYRLKLESAKELLLRGFYSKTIWRRLSYSDECHLIKRFKLGTGVTPAVWRASAKEAAKAAKAAARAQARASRDEFKAAVRAASAKARAKAIAKAKTAAKKKPTSKFPVDGRRFAIPETKMVYLMILERQQHLREMSPEAAALEEMRLHAGCIVQYPMNHEVEAFVIDRQITKSLKKDPRNGNVLRMSDLVGMSRNNVAKTFERNNDGRGLMDERAQVAERERADAAELVACASTA